MSRRPRRQPHERRLGPTAVLDDAEVARWSHAADVFGGVLASLRKFPFACEHLVAQAAASQPAIAYVCAEHATMRCERCFDEHLDADDAALGCVVPDCGIPRAVCAYSSYDQLVEHMLIGSLEAATLTMARMLGLRILVPLCKSHGSGHQWRATQRLSWSIAPPEPA